MHGYQHTLVNTSATALICLPLYHFGLPITSASLAAGLLIGTLFVTPDLDLHFNDAKRRWGHLRFIWVPYSSLSKHRGMSHTYLFGPTIRLAYLTTLILPPALIWHSLTGQWWPATEPLNVRRLIVGVIGYYLSQWLHLLCDGILPLSRRNSRRVT